MIAKCGLAAAVVFLMGIGAQSIRPTIPFEYERVARLAQVPSDILYAIALTESGRTIDDQHGFRPWPWTLNLSGKASVHDTRIDAHTQLRSFLDDGSERVDVGLMQVNWRFHQSRFESSYESLDPRTNLLAGARILRSCWVKEQDWWRAVGCYHAPYARQRARDYRERVRKNWQQHVPISLRLSDQQTQTQE